MKIPGIFLEEKVPVTPPRLLIGIPVFVGFAPNSVLSQNQADGALLKEITLWSQFQYGFGRLEGFLKDAVRGFFENGGDRCHILLLPLPEKQILVVGELQKLLVAGLEKLEVLNTVDLICAPDLMYLQRWFTNLTDQNIQHLQAEILNHCERMGDRFAILDAHNGSSKTVRQQIEDLSQANGDRGSYGALYYPWLKVEGQSSAVPPCGHIAGTYSRCDRTFGVHHAPANYPLEGVLDLTANLSKTEQATLNSAAQSEVNCIRAFRGRGIRVWGARTLSQESQWQYINVRRLFLTVGRWINFHLADAVFEPNDASLWRRLERELSVYCESLWRQGALQGETAKEAFYIHCNAMTNSASMRDEGQVYAELGLAPTVPGEFIRVALIHGDSGVTLSPT